MRDIYSIAFTFILSHFNIFLDILKIYHGLLGRQYISLTTVFRTELYGAHVLGGLSYSVNPIHILPGIHGINMVNVCV